MPITFSCLLACSCSFFSNGQGQVIYHWERENTGIEKFSRDHSECMRSAENIRLPDFRTWFYSEEVKLDIRADWHAEKAVGSKAIFLTRAQCLLLSIPCEMMLIQTPKSIVYAWKTKATGIAPITCHPSPIFTFINRNACCRMFRLTTTTINSLDGAARNTAPFPISKNYRQIPPEEY